MSTKKRKGGRVTQSPKVHRRAVADELVDRFISAGWTEADEDDVQAINAHILPISTVCTCSPEETSEFITTIASSPDAPRQAVAVMLHDGPPYGALIWSGAV